MVRFPRPIRRVSAVAVAALASAGCGMGVGDGSGSGGDALVAYVADAETSGVHELFVSDLEGDGVRKVSGPTVLFSSIYAFKWSPDRTRIAFHSDRDVNGRFDLYVADLAADGADPPNVAAVGPDAPSGSVQAFSWSPDGTKIAFIASEGVDAKALFVVDLSAPVPQPVQVSPTPPPTGSIQGFSWSPLGDRVAYSGMPLTLGRTQLFSVEPDGGDPELLSVAEPGVTTDDVSGFAWSPDGSRIAFVFNPAGGNVRKLFTCLPDGGDLQPRCGVHWPNTGVEAFAWSPDGSRIAYAADQDANDLRELFVTDPVAGPPLEVGPAAGIADVGTQFTWSPDSTRIAYTLDFTGTASSQVRIASKAGGFPGVAADFDDALVGRPEWSPDGDRVAFLAAKSDANGFHLLTDLHVAAADGSGEDVVGPAAADQDVMVFEWSPDGERIAYLRNELVVGANLYVVDEDGGAPVPLSDVPPSLNQISSAGHARWTSDSRRVVFLAGAPDGVGDPPPRRLWVATLLGGVAVEDVTPDPTGALEVTTFEIE